MNRTIFSVLLLVCLGMAYLWMNDFFRKQPIQITPSIRPGRMARDSDVFPVTFMLDGKYKLTTFKVVSVAESKTNKYARAIWDMFSDSSSQETKIIIYGQPIKGMKPRVPRTRAEPLQANTPYRLIVEAGNYRGEVDFKTVEAVKPQ